MKRRWAQEVGRLGYRARSPTAAAAATASSTSTSRTSGRRPLRLLRPRARKAGPRGWPRATACSTTTSPGPSSAGAAQPPGHRGPRVLPRHPVRLRLRRGRLDDGVHRHLGRGAGRRRRQRQPPVPPLRPGRRPRDAPRPLRPPGRGHYGNWAFFEYLSQRYGAGIVRRIWENAAAGPQAAQLLHAGGQAHLPAGTTFGGLPGVRRGQHRSPSAPTPRARPGRRRRWPGSTRCPATPARPRGRSTSTTWRRSTCWSGPRGRCATPTGGSADHRRTAVHLDPGGVRAGAPQDGGDPAPAGHARRHRRGPSRSVRAPEG